MAPKKHSGKKHSGGKKRSRCMNGGMTTGQWGSAAFGDSNSQRAVGNGSNVIQVHDPNSVVSAPQMKGGRRRRYRGGADPTDGSATDGAPAGIRDSITGAYDKATEIAASWIPASLIPAAASADNNASAAPAQEPVSGGKGKRKSATKRRKSHKKKGKSSKKRAHKRH